MEKIETVEQRDMALARVQEYIARCLSETYHLKMAGAACLPPSPVLTRLGRATTDLLQAQKEINRSRMYLTALQRGPQDDDGVTVEVGQRVMYVDRFDAAVGNHNETEGQVVDVWLAEAESEWWVEVRPVKPSLGLLETTSHPAIAVKVIRGVDRKDVPSS